MNNINLFVFLILLYCLYVYTQSSREQFTITTSNKDWLEQIFDYRQIITIPVRLQYVHNFCKTFEIKPTIFNAILKSDIEYDNVHRLSLGEIACTLSQEKVLNNFLETNHTNMIMFEDDNISFNSKLYEESGLKLGDIKEYIKNAVESLPSNWDILYLGRCWDNCSKNKRINKYLFKTYRTLCHHAIAFSRNGAKQVLKSIIHPINVPVDHLVAQLVMNGTIDAYATVIPIFYQNRDELSSTIGNFDNLPVCM